MFTEARGNTRLARGLVCVSAYASALLLAYHGFEQANSERMQRTHQRIRQRLIPRAGLVYRNERSLQLREGAFAICSFWEVDFLARSGHADLTRLRLIEDLFVPTDPTAPSADPDPD